MDAALKAEKEKATGAVKAAVECVTIPFTAIESDEHFRLLSISQIDYACMGTPVEPTSMGVLSISSLRQALTRMGDPALSAPVMYKVAGREAAFVRGTAHSAKLNVTFYAGISCIHTQEKFVGCWIYMALKPEDVADMALSPLTFDGDTAQPVVPKDIASRATLTSGDQEGTPALSNKKY